MFICKLMVVSAFESFKRGDYIYDQELIAKICDPNDLMHGYVTKVRKMNLTEQEKKMYLAPEPVVIEPVEEKPVELKIESIKDDKNKPSKSKGE